MKWSRFVFKAHKWLAVAAGLFTLLWFVSGLVMALPARLFGVPERMSTKGTAGPGYKEIAVSVPQAIAAVESSVGRTVQVTGIGFRRIAGQLLYRVQTDGAGAHLVDAVSGEQYVIDEARARELLRLADPAATGGELTLLRAFDADYRQGPLPVYRLTLGDARGTTYYLGAEMGEVRAINRGRRWRRAITGMHTLEFLEGMTGSAAVRLLLVGASAVGTLMTVFGLWILWIQLANWRAGRRAR